MGRNVAAFTNGVCEVCRGAGKAEKWEMIGGDSWTLVKKKNTCLAWKKLNKVMSCFYSTSGYCVAFVSDADHISFDELIQSQRGLLS